MRTARLHLPHAVHHLIWRFVDRAWYFTSADERRRYLWWLGRSLADSDWRCLAFALMSNHIHLAVVAGHEDLAAWSRRAHAPFARWMNDRQGRLGGLFADRARDFAVAPETARELIAYIHNNPVRAGVVTRAADSDWTSHRAYLGLAVRPAWLHVRDGLSRGGFATPSDFGDYVDGTPREPAAPDVRRISTAVKRHGAIQVGTPTDQLVPFVARPYACIRPNPVRLVEIVCELTGAALAEVRSRRRNPQLVGVRRLVVHSGRALGLVGSDIAAALGISKQAVSRIALATTVSATLREQVCRRVADEVLRFDRVS